MSNTPDSKNESQAQSYSTFLEYFNSSAKCQTKLDQTIQDSVVADLAAERPIKVELWVARLNAGQVRAIVKSNVSSEEMRTMFEVVHPVVVAMIKDDLEQVAN